MNFREYNEWDRHHRIYFPAVNDWFNKLPDDTRDETRKAWREALSDISLDAAKQATKILLKGDGSDKPFGHSDIPATINRIARGLRRSGGGYSKRPKPRKIDGQPVFVCNVCEDSGFVVVWHSEVVQAMREDRFEGVFPYEAVARCSDCEYGRSLSETIPLYDSNRDCRISEHWNPELSLSELQEFAANVSQFGAVEWK